MKKLQLLDLMNSGRLVERRREGDREVWRVEGQPCGTAVKALIKAGLAEGHYPTGRGILNLTDAGKAKRRAVFTVEAGRCIYRNGEPYVIIGRCDRTSPTDADAETHNIAKLLNAHGGVTPHE